MSQQVTARVPPSPPEAEGHEHRRHPRYTVQYRLRYSTKIGTKTTYGEGMLTDVSNEGCGIQGSRPVKQGERVTVDIQLPKSKVGFRLEGVKVMWASGSRFGVQSQECSQIVSQLSLIPPPDGPL